jgi:hypothetical protein
MVGGRAKPGGEAWVQVRGRSKDDGGSRGDGDASRMIQRMIACHEGVMLAKLFLSPMKSTLTVPPIDPASG